MHGPSWSKLDDDDDILKGVGAAEGDGQILLPQDMRNAKIFSGGVAFPRVGKGLQGRRESTARRRKDARPTKNALHRVLLLRQ